jgi:hypothetical protein
MRLLNKTFALLIVSLFVVSFSIAASSAALPNKTAGESSLIIQDPIDYAIPADEGTNVDWYTDTGDYNDTWTWSNNYWLFGPRANYELFYNNGSGSLAQGRTMSSSTIMDPRFMKKISFP